MSQDIKLYPYSVLLLYPDYITDGTKTYYAHVYAKNLDDAVTLAQMDAALAQPKDNLHAIDPVDFLTLGVWLGHVEQGCVLNNINVD